MGRQDLYEAAEIFIKSFDARKDGALTRDAKDQLLYSSCIFENVLVDHERDFEGYLPSIAYELIGGRKTDDFTNSLIALDEQRGQWNLGNVSTSFLAVWLVAEAIVKERATIEELLSGE